MVSPDVQVYNGDIEVHPLLGSMVNMATGETTIYTRTWVVYLVNINVDLQRLSDSICVTDIDVADPQVPTVVMMQYHNQTRGFLLKRLTKQQWFRSMLNMDVAYNGKIPHFKISSRNTIHVTGCCQATMLCTKIRYLLHRYMNNGLTLCPGAQDHTSINSKSVGFVSDVVMSNVSFVQNVHEIPVHVPRMVDIGKAINDDVTDEGCNWTAVVRQRQSTLNVVAFGAKTDWKAQFVFAFVPLRSQLDWYFIKPTDASTIWNLRIGTRSACDSFRIFQSGSVVQVGRWPTQMIERQSQLLSLLSSFKTQTDAFIYKEQHAS